MVVKTKTVVVHPPAAFQVVPVIENADMSTLGEGVTRGISARTSYCELYIAYNELLKFTSEGTLNLPVIGNNKCPEINNLTQ